MRRERYQASVTVFFSLSFALLLSFALTFYEAAAETARGAYEEAAARLAAESFFAGYDYPLYEMYHIFGRELPALGDGGRAYMQEEISADLLAMTKREAGELSLLRREGAAIEVTGTVALTENKGLPFYEEVAAYMKYRSVAELISFWKEGKTEEARVQARLSAESEKEKVDEAYAAAEEELLLLMELIDGVELSKYEKYLRGKTTVFQAKHYVKYFSVLSDEEAAAYFEREEIFHAYLKNHEDPLQKTEALYGLAERLLAATEEEAEITARLEELEEERRREEEEEKQKEAGEGEEGEEVKEGEEEAEETGEETEREGKTEGEKSEEEREKEEARKEREKEEKELKKRLQEVKKEKKQCRSELSAAEQAFQDRKGKVAASCEKALEVLGRLEEKLQTARRAREGLEAALPLMELLGGEEISERLGELTEYDCYEPENGCDFAKMAETIRFNKLLLDGIKPLFFSEGQEAVKGLLEALSARKEALAGYSFVGLLLPYGSRELSEAGVQDAKKALTAFLSDGFLSLLLKEEPSASELEASDLPSAFYLAGGELRLALAELFQGGGVKALTERLRSSFLPAGDDWEQLLTPFLFQLYLQEHFRNYAEPGGEHGSVLAYEQEYLLCGQNTDKENLAQTAVRIIALRMALHFAALLGNGEKRREAELAAAVLTGVIGLPALKRVAAAAFLLVWAAEEALIDMAALFAGKKLAFYPGKNGGSLAFSELLLFRKELLQAKAAQKQENGAFAFGYKEYLQLFLFGTMREKLCYRAMDLIQENLRKAGHDGFTIRRCISKADFLQGAVSFSYSY